MITFLVIVLIVTSIFGVSKKSDNKKIKSALKFMESLPIKVKKELGMLIHENQEIPKKDFFKQVDEIFKKNKNSKIIPSKIEAIKFVASARRLCLINMRKRRVYSSNSFYQFVNTKKELGEFDSERVHLRMIMADLVSKLGSLPRKVLSKKASVLLGFVPCIEKVYKEFYPY